MRLRRHTGGGRLGGYFHLQGQDHRRIFGHGDGDYIRLRDEYGNVWRGTAEFQQDGTVRYLFRDQNGKSVSGLGDANGIMLRDEKGHSWRGFVD